MLKAIETKYKGYRFRSRLEARWAVFFDAMGIEWEYEKEGYELPSGWYLPDFWLPQVDMFAEIKGEAFKNIELGLCSQLCYESKTPVLALSGIPSLRYYPAIIQVEYNHGAWDGRVAILDILDSNHYFISESRFFTEDFDSIDLGCRYEPMPESKEYALGNMLENITKKRKYTEPDCHSCLKAVEAARSARFEHGERG